MIVVMLVYVIMVKTQHFPIVQESKCNDLFVRWVNYYCNAGKVCATKLDDDKSTI